MRGLPWIALLCLAGSPALAKRPAPAPTRLEVELKAERDHKALADRDSELAREHRTWMAEHRRIAPKVDAAHARIERKHLAKLRRQRRIEAQHDKWVAAHQRLLNASGPGTGLTKAQADQLAADHIKMRADHERMYLELLQMRAQHDTMVRAHGGGSAPSPAP